MSGNERLGLEIYVTSDQCQKALSDLSRSLQSLNTTNMSSLSGAFSNLSSQLQSAQSNTSKMFQSVTQSMNATRQALQQTSATLTQTTNALNNNTQTLDTSLGSIAKRLIEFYAIRTALTEITGQISSSIKDIIGLNQAVHDIGAIANASTDSMTKFKGSILDIATASKMSLSEVEKLQNLLAQSGIDAQDVPQTSKVVAAFATGTGSDPEQAVRSFTTAMNVWEIEADKASRIANVFTAGLNASKLEVNDLSTVFNYLATTAKQVGMSLEETTGTIAALSQAGLKASTIGTSLTQLLSKLMAPNNKLKKFLVEEGDIKNLDEVNPRLHSFADIIERLQQANLPVEGILASFGDRAGRTMNAALTLGSEYFRMMQANVTGTGAAFTAYSESMDGAVAKINVLRQEATRAAQVISDDLSGLFSSGYDSAMTFVHGLETGGGRVALAVEAITLALGGLSVAFQALKKWNPEVQAISLAMAGVTAAVTATIGAFGKLKEVPLEESSAKIREYAKEAAGMQRVFTGLNAEYTRAATAKQLDNKLSEASKQHIRELAREYPGLMNMISLTTGTYRDLFKVMDQFSQKRRETSAKLLPEINRLEQMEKALKAPYQQSRQDKIKQADNADSEISRLQATKPSSTMTQSGINLRIAQLKADKEGIYKSINRSYGQEQADLGSITALKDKALLGGDFVYDEKSGKWTLAPEVTVKPRTATEGYHPTDDKAAKAAQKAAEKQVRGENAWSNYVEKEKDKISQEQAKAERDRNELILRDKEKSEEERTDALFLIVSDNYKRYAAEQSNRIRELNAEFAKDHSLQFNADIWEFTDKAGNAVNGDKLRNLVGNKDLQTLHDMRNQIVKDSAAKAETDNEKALSELGHGKVYNSDRDERAADKDLKITQETLNIRKQLAETAEQVRNIEIEGIQAEQEAAAKKEAAYRLELQSLDKRKISGELLEADKLRYSEINDKLTDIVNKETELSIQLRVKSDDTFQGNLFRGVHDAQKGFGTEQDRTIELGKNVTNTFENGITNSLTGMISALQKGTSAWKAFRAGLANTMQGVVDELNKYIAKMFAVWAMEKLIGVFTNSGVTPSNGATASYSNGLSFDANGSWTGRSIYGDMANLGYAEGGQIPLNMGIAGVDSVPAMLMPGEIIINKSAVDYYGADRLLALNSQKIQRFAEGGVVGSSSNSTLTNKATGQPWILNITNVADPNSIPQQPTNAQEVINIVSFDAAKKGTTYRTFKGIINN